MRADARPKARLNGVTALIDDQRQNGNVQRASRTGRPVDAVEGEDAVLRQVTREDQADVAVIERRPQLSRRVKVAETGHGCEDAYNRQSGPGEDERGDPGGNLAGVAQRESWQGTQVR